MTAVFLTRSQCTATCHIAVLESPAAALSKKPPIMLFTDIPLTSYDLFIYSIINFAESSKTL